LSCIPGSLHIRSSELPIVTAEFIDWLFKQRQETSGEKQHPLHKLDKNNHFEKDLEDNMLETLIVTFTIRQVPVN